MTNEETDNKRLFWLKNQTRTFEIKNGAKWVLGNSLARGFYRVNYDKENWDKIIELLHNSHTTFHEVDRMKIMDDLTAISQ